MKQPTAIQRAETVRHLVEAQELLRRQISEDERVQAAYGLHNEHMLPEQEDLLAA